MFKTNVAVDFRVRGVGLQDLLFFDPDTNKTTSQTDKSVYWSVRPVLGYPLWPAIGGTLFGLGFCFRFSGLGFGIFLGLRV